MLKGRAAISKIMQPLPTDNLPDWKIGQSSFYDALPPFIKLLRNEKMRQKSNFHHIFGKISVFIATWYSFSHLSRE